MHQYSQGKSTKQAHKGVPEGQYEEEQGLKGFFGPVSHLIKAKPSTRWKKIEGPLKPRMYDLTKIKATGLRQRLLFNQQVVISFWKMPSFSGKEGRALRNADGDTIYFCHSGNGQLWTEYGLLNFRKGHYVVVPKCITHFFRNAENCNFFVIENRNSHYEEPERGLVGRHAIYDPAQLEKPDLEALHREQKKAGVQVLEVEVKHSDEVTLFQYEECVFDTLGWKGDLFPFLLHTDNMMPLMSHRAHLPPSAHTTFVARDFVICTFLPRPLEEDDDALKVPFYHQNIDYDEVLFYHDGDFFSRDNLHAGMMSFHPAGFPHGPHPKAIEKAKDKKRTDEYAVMVDTRWPLQWDPAIEDLENKDYWQSWMR